MGSARGLQVGRDPFARVTVRRRRGFSRTGCRWCGSVRQRLWSYYADADSPREGGDVAGGHAFCNVTCLRSYLD